MKLVPFLTLGAVLLGSQGVYSAGRNDAEGRKNAKELERTEILEKMEDSILRRGEMTVDICESNLDENPALKINAEMQEKGEISFSDISKTLKINASIYEKAIQSGSLSTDMLGCTIALKDFMLVSSSKLDSYANNNKLRIATKKMDKKLTDKVAAAKTAGNDYVVQPTKNHVNKTIEGGKSLYRDTVDLGKKGIDKTVELGKKGVDKTKQLGNDYIVQPVVKSHKYVVGKTADAMVATDEGITKAKNATVKKTDSILDSIGNFLINLIGDDEEADKAE